MFTVFAIDNSQAPVGAGSARGTFPNYDAALAAARGIVDRSLAELHRPGMRAQDLFSHYMLYGEDAFIEPVADGEKFSGRVYARLRCVLLCG